MTGDRGRRPKRRCATNTHYDSSALPSAVHYVGYVEDDETPEMIMAKFVELEKIQKAELSLKNETNAKSMETNTEDSEGEGDPSKEQRGSKQTLTDEQLLEVFKQTSMFNVKTALKDNAMLLGIDDVLGYTSMRYGSEDPVSDDDEFLKSFWSDDEMDTFNGSEDSEGEAEAGRIRRKGTDGRCGIKIPRKSSTINRDQRHKIVTAFNPETQAYVRRKVRIPDPDEIVQIRIPPPPLPVSWGRTVKPYVACSSTRSDVIANQLMDPTPSPDSAFYIELRSMEELKHKALPLQSYQAALINVGWARTENGRDALSSLSHINLPKLVPEGFIFIWTPKHFIHSVCKRMTRWGYVYVENLTWCYLSPNNSLLRLPLEHYVANSHLSLYIFRMADKGKDIELRHQRNPDVVFDCVASTDERGQIANPRESLVAIQTLLPSSAGKLIEFWAPKDVKRPGWTHVVEL